MIAERPASSTPHVEFRGVDKTFIGRAGVVDAIQDVSIAIDRGEFIAVVGPSGCGKSTLLKMTAGLMAPTRGTVLYSGAQLKGVNTLVGYMAQKDDILPWTSVERNIDLALRIRGVRERERNEQLASMIERMGLAGFGKAYPSSLSGGMRKRVALARTLIYKPETLLMDEPFSALDAQVRVLMHAELLHLWSGSGATVIFVTHDLDEAITLSDRIVVMSARPGRVKAIKDVDIPRPRDPLTIRGNAEFNRLRNELWTLLKEEIHFGTAV
ncbi:MAG TPA: ABC transporter ATP-binding protein [Burkholderiales bacterium]|nr:ABC transporter ATP-binding protein [Burkholderiales bacterium]